MPAPLSPAMRAALTTIRTGVVTYRFLPVKRSVRRPLPVTSRDLTPVYSHGLNAATVEALIRRGVVTLSAYSNDHGRTLAVGAEEF